MKVTDTVELPELSEDNFKKLTPEACRAFTFRAAVRVMPLIGCGSSGLGFWPTDKRQQYMEAVVLAIDAALLMSVRERNDYMVYVADIASGAVGRAAGDIQDLGVREAVYSAADAAAPVDAYQTAEIVAKTAMGAIEVSRLAMQRDLWQLLRWSNEKPTKSVEANIISTKLMFSPLLQDSGGLESFFELQGDDGIKHWKSSLAEIGMEDVVQRYMDLVDGKPWDIDETTVRFNAWYKKYQEQENIIGNSQRSDSGKAFTKGHGTATTLSDKPTNIDKLGRAPLVNTLANMLASPQQDLPMTIALLGDWGTGKSSVIVQLKSRLTELEEPRLFIGGSDEACKFLHAEFNAWEYEQTDNIRAGLAQEVVNGLLKDVNWLHKLCFAFYNAWKQHRWAFGWSLIGMIVVVLSAAGLWLGGATIFTKNVIAGSLIGVGAAGVFSFVLFNAWKTARNILEHPLANQLQTYLKLPSYGEHLGLVPVIKEQIASMCEYRLGQAHNSRLLVVVDDLDRCSPECITDTLDAVRLVMNLKNVVVLIAIDDRVAFRAVADHYEKLSDKERPAAAIARDYLGKIIQLPINLPLPNGADMGRFINDELFQHVEQSRKKQVGGMSVAGIDDANVPIEVEEPVEPDGIIDTGKPVEQDKPSEPDNSGEMDESLKEMHILMRDTTDERNEFRELVLDLGFNNPRQLIRLKNSYRVLKGIKYNESGPVSFSKCRELLLGLFWSEYLFQLPVEVDGPVEPGRRHAELLMIDVLRDQNEENDEIPAIVGNRFSQLFENSDDKLNVYFTLMKIGIAGCVIQCTRWTFIK